MFFMFVENSTIANRLVSAKVLADLWEKSNQELNSRSLYFIIFVFRIPMDLKFPEDLAAPTKREIQELQLVASGKTIKGIAKTLDISEDATNRLSLATRPKLGANIMLRARVMAKARGMIDLPQ